MLWQILWIIRRLKPEQRCEKQSTEKKQLEEQLEEPRNPRRETQKVLRVLEEPFRRAKWARNGQNQSVTNLRKKTIS